MLIPNGSFANLKGMDRIYLNLVSSEIEHKI